MKRILLVCTGNTCRSVMAQGLFKLFSKEMGVALKVESAGLNVFTQAPAARQALEVMESYSVDMSQHRSQQVKYEDLEKYDLILTMTTSHKQQILNSGAKLKDRVFTLKEYADKSEQESMDLMENNEKIAINKSSLQWDINDPFGQSVEIYQETASEMAIAIKKILARWQ